VIKLSAATGAELWRQEINGTTTAAEDIASAVTVDAAGDVIAAGELINGGREGDFAVIKFAGSTGMEVWRQQIDQDGGPDYAFAVAVEETGDVIAGGGLSHKHYGNPGFAVVELSALDGAAGPARGRSLMVRDLAGTPSARTISAFAQDTSIVTPALGTVGDPTLAGATLRLVNAITLESATFVLPGGASWTARSTATGSLSYLYQDRAGINGPCTRVQVTTGILKAVCTGRAGAIPFTLDEPNQGKLAVSLRLGNGAAQCATFGGKVQRDAGTADPGPLGIFKATKAPAASGDCP